MIKLKSGKEIVYDENFDVFFMNLLDTIISEAKTKIKKSSGGKDGIYDNEKLIKEIMDNCIYITHQLFELFKKNESMPKFVVTGFLFNSIMLTLTQSNLKEDLLSDYKSSSDSEDDGTVH